MLSISLNPPYIPLIQKPNCCAITCLQMILYRNGFGLQDQEEMAIEFGVKIRAEDAGAFRSAMPIVTEENFDEGIPTVESEELINRVLSRYAPSLIARSFKYSSVPSTRDFLRTNLEAGNDIWVEYHGHEIHAEDAYKGIYIHDGLIESFDLKNEMLTIIDPLPTHRQRLFVKIPILERSVSSLYGQETGFVIVTHENR